MMLYSVYRLQLNNIIRTVIFIPHIYFLLILRTSRKPTHNFRYIMLSVLIVFLPL